MPKSITEKPGCRPRLPACSELGRTKAHTLERPLCPPRASRGPSSSPWQASLFFSPRQPPFRTLHPPRVGTWPHSTGVAFAHCVSLCGTRPPPISTRPQAPPAQRPMEKTVSRHLKPWTDRHCATACNSKPHSEPHCLPVFSRLLPEQSPPWPPRPACPKSLS